MKNLTYIFVVLLCFSNFALQALDSRDHPIAKSKNGEYICIDILENAPYDYSRTFGIELNLNLGSYCGEEVLPSLYLVAYDDEIGSNILASSSVALGFTTGPYTTICQSETIYRKNVEIVIPQLNLPCPTGSFSYYLTFMLLEDDQFVSLSDISAAQYNCLLDMFPQACYVAPSEIGLTQFGFCYNCTGLTPPGNPTGPTGDRINNNSGLSQKKEISTAQTVNAFPNPFSEQVNVRIQSTVASKGVIELFDVQGRRVANQTIELLKGINEFNISTADLPKGLYFLQLISDESIKTLKIIKGNH